MIVLENVEAFLPSGRVVLSGLSCAVSPTSRVAVLCFDAELRTAFLQLLAGMRFPKRGVISRSASVSFPVGFPGGFHEDLSVRDNVAHAARVYGMSVTEVVAFVQRLVDIGDEYDRPWRGVTRRDRTFVSTVLTYTIAFDIYLVDRAIMRGDDQMRNITKYLFEERMQSSGCILATQNTKEAKQYCNVGAVLHSGRLHWFDAVDDAISAFKQLEPTFEPIQHSPVSDSDQEF